MLTWILMNGTHSLDKNRLLIFKICFFFSFFSVIIYQGWGLFQWFFREVIFLVFLLRESDSVMGTLTWRVSAILSLLYGTFIQYPHGIFSRTVTPSIWFESRYKNFLLKNRNKAKPRRISAKKNQYVIHQLNKLKPTGKI